HENCFSNFCEFQLISEGVASASAVYTCLERETKVFFTFVPRSLLKSIHGRNFDKSRILLIPSK
ncbi:hypothetical protein ACR759_06785, partial [Enterococcus faecium]|uniref:hypothetical protein n=1 Tax=Enterococcus faecium TaxID=1352 RepID=UPI003DA49501